MVDAIEYKILVDKIRFWDWAFLTYIDIQVQIAKFQRIKAKIIFALEPLMLNKIRILNNMFKKPTMTNIIFSNWMSSILFSSAGRIDKI